MNVSGGPGMGSGHGNWKADGGGIEMSLEHCLLILWHRKWLVLSIFLLVSAVTAIVSSRMPNIYTSETLILVDPQKVPPDYVSSTITGDVRNRMGTLSQQILSATRLQRVIEVFDLYAKERKTLSREEVINKMRSDVSVKVVSNFGAKQVGEDLQAFKVTYSGIEPRVVAQVTNEMASLFITENLKAREQMATGTTEFLNNQLEETRKVLEVQETRLRDFKLAHIGEMPGQQQANLQILGQLQTQLQGVISELSRAEQQRSYLQSLAAQPVPTRDQNEPAETGSAQSENELKLAALVIRYSERHPDLQSLRKMIEAEQKLREKEEQTKLADTPAAPAAVAQHTPSPGEKQNNRVLESQSKAIDAEIANLKKEQQRLRESAAAYQARIEVIPVREQQIADLVRDYDISKSHYSQLLGKKFGAEMATELEIRQKGEKFIILDPAQVAEKPSSPNRLLINAVGSLGGLALGLAAALVTEVLGMSITSASQITTFTGIPLLGVITVIRTYADRRRKRWIIAGTASGVVTMMALGGFLLYHFREQIF